MTCRYVRYIQICQSSWHWRDVILTDSHGTTWSGLRCWLRLRNRLRNESGRLFGVRGAATKVPGPRLSWLLHDSMYIPLLRHTHTVSINFLSSPSSPVSSDLLSSLLISSHLLPCLSACLLRDPSTQPGERILSPGGRLWRLDDMAIKEQMRNGRRQEATWRNAWVWGIWLSFWNSAKFQFQSSGVLRILAAEQALCVRIPRLMYLAFTKGADVEFAKSWQTSSVYASAMGC